MPVPLDLLHKVPLSSWSLLLRAHGLKAVPKSIDDVRRLLEKGSAPLTDAVRTLRTLGHADVRPMLLEASEILSVPMPDAAASLGTADWVVQWLAKAPRSDAHAEALEAVHKRLCRREPRAPSRRYLTEGQAARMTATPAALKQLAKALERAGEARHAPGKVDVTVLGDPDATDREPGRLTLEIVRPEPTEPVFVRDARGKATLQYQTRLEVDCLVLERRPSDGAWALWVWTAAPDLLPAYVEAAGAALLGAPSAFTSAPSVSFDALQWRAGHALDVRHARTARLKNARVVALWSDSGWEETIAIAGRNVLAALEREDALRTGQISGVVVRLDFDDGPVDVTLRTPNVVHWEPCAHNAAIRAFIDSLGLDEAPRYNLVTLAPHDHPAWKWLRGLGDEVFAFLQKAGCFRETSSRALAHPDHLGAGRISLAFELTSRGQGRHYAVAEEGFDVRSRLVGEADLVTLRLDLLGVAGLIGAAIGVRANDEAHSSGTSALLERGTLIDVGELPIGGTAARVFLVVGGGHTKGLAARLRPRCGGAHPVLLVPRGYHTDSGCAEVELPPLGPQLSSLRAAIGRALGVTTGPGLTARAPAGTRAAVERRTGKIEIDGVEMKAMAESTQKLVRTLVEAGGAPVSGDECDKAVSAKRTGAGAAKAAKKKFVAGVGASFALQGKEPPADVEEMIVGTGVGYRMTVKCWIG